MNVLLISQCTKNALVETRRILDQFAERRGDRTWQTPITQQGLETLHRLLRQSARKNTAVACHWIRSKDHSELLWVVGDARQFNARGATPTNITSRDVLRTKDENDWHSAEDIRLLASLAALFHDFGKASDAFQAKLKGNARTADPYRHEWVSLRLFESFVGNAGKDDASWLARLADPSAALAEECLKRLKRDGLDGVQRSPFAALPPLAQVVGWLIVSHHRIPTPPFGSAWLHPTAFDTLPCCIEDDWCGAREKPEPKALKDCWGFAKGLPFGSRHWQAHAARVAQAIVRRPAMLERCAPDDPYVMHLSRLALMLADHYYSSEPSHARYGDAGNPRKLLHANTDKVGALKQRLDEHLIGVEVNAGRIVRALPRMDGQLARIARHKGMRARSKDQFRWQNKAFDLAEGLQRRSRDHGFFGVNMASTGCGKTLANGRIMYALADPERGTRFTCALGLRTLTLQTGDAYRERLRLGSEDLAVLVGGGAVRALHEQQLAEEAASARSGSESQAELIPEHSHVVFEGSLEDGPLNEWLKKNTDAQRLLDAPVLVCTIDHLMPACESLRGGHQIAPMLRLMSSDLILDEPDDFGIEDLPALTRLVNWAGMLGSRVLLSSATLPPALIQGLFEAYLEGRRIFQKHRGVPGQPLDVCCAWFDEFGAETSAQASPDSYRTAHDAFVTRRLARLGSAERRRRAEVRKLGISRGEKREQVVAAFAAKLREFVQELHARHHDTDPATGSRVSFGLVRMANIDPLVEVARELFALGAPEGMRIHLCVYHSRHPLLVRAGIERRLDRLLDRKLPDAPFRDVEVRAALDGGGEKDHVFIVLGTAVTEVGRDHDYDWGIVEPSSMRSIIQLAGRIRRHRPGSCTVPNLYLLDTNLRYLLHGDRLPVFCRPGFEDANFRLVLHRLDDLLTAGQLEAIDASSRIRERDALDPARNLVDLEHGRLRDLMLGAPAGSRQATQCANHWWRSRASLCGEMQRRKPFRDDPLGRVRHALVPDENEALQFVQLLPGKPPNGVGNLLHPVILTFGPRIEPWGCEDYEAALADLAEARGMAPADCAMRFGVVDLPGRGAEQGWWYHPVLGFSRFR